MNWQNKVAPVVPDDKAKAEALVDKAPARVMVLVKADHGKPSVQITAHRESGEPAYATATFGCEDQAAPPKEIKLEWVNSAGLVGNFSARVNKNGAWNMLLQRCGDEKPSKITKMATSTHIPLGVDRSEDFTITSLKVERAKTNVKAR